MAGRYMEAEKFGGRRMPCFVYSHDSPIDWVPTIKVLTARLSTWMKPTVVQ